jgi:hypothetical protein
MIVVTAMAPSDLVRDLAAMGLRPLAPFCLAYILLKTFLFLLYLHTNILVYNTLYAEVGTGHCYLEV